jgi:hypothetical protein
METVCYSERLSFTDESTRCQHPDHHEMFIMLMQTAGFRSSRYHRHVSTASHERADMPRPPVVVPRIIFYPTREMCSVLRWRLQFSVSNLDYNFFHITAILVNKIKTSLLSWFNAAVSTFGQRTVLQRSQLSEQTNVLNGFSDLDPIFTSVNVERIIDDNCQKGRIVVMRTKGVRPVQWGPVRAICSQGSTRMWQPCAVLWGLHRFALRARKRAFVGWFEVLRGAGRRSHNGDWAGTWKETMVSSARCRDWLKPWKLSQPITLPRLELGAYRK